MKDVITAKEAAQRLDVSIGTVYESMRRGEIPTIELGRRRVIPRPAFEAMLAGRMPTAADPRTLARELRRESLRLQLQAIQTELETL